jgi:hypothetical protein
MVEPPELVDLSAPEPDEGLRRVAAIHRRMYLLVALVALVGFSAFAAVLVMAQTRSLYREHYVFRAAVRPGMTGAQVQQRFGEPYRVYGAPEALKPVLEGRGRYQRFSPDVTHPGVVPPGWAQALHYRTTLEHGEFVFLDASGKVLAVVTGRPGEARSMPLPGQAPEAANAAPAAEPDAETSAESEFGRD